MAQYINKIEIDGVEVEYIKIHNLILSVVLAKDLKPNEAALIPNGSMITRLKHAEASFSEDEGVLEYNKDFNPSNERIAFSSNGLSSTVVWLKPDQKPRRKNTPIKQKH